MLSSNDAASTGRLAGAYTPHPVRVTEHINAQWLLPPVMPDQSGLADQVTGQSLERDYAPAGPRGSNGDARQFAV